MRISVVIPVLDGQSFLAQAIRSARDQSLPPVEIIVADNGSRDASLAIARSFGPPVRVISAPRPGAAAARAAGYAEATGEALMFLDADDLLAPDTLAHLADALRGRGAALACCSWRRYDLKGDCWRAGPASCAPRRPYHDDLAAWLTGWYHPPCSLLWSREAYEAAGGWDPTTSLNDDGDLVMRALVAGVPLIPAAGGIGYYRRLPAGAQSLSGQNRSARGLAARLRVLEKIETLLLQAGREGRYASPLAEAYRQIADECPIDGPEEVRDSARDGVSRNGGFGGVRRAARRLGEAAGRSWTGGASPGPNAIPAPGVRSAAETDSPLVSVILPTYNRAATLRRAIDSVLGQSYANLELLVVDDGSTDDTPRLVETLCDPRLRYLPQENRGVAAARNLGLEQSRGRLIAFLDSDDAWMPEKLARQVAQMQAAPGRVGLLYTGLAVSHEDGRVETWTPKARGHVLPEILKSNVLHFGTSSTMIRAEAAEVVGGFDSTLPANEDHDYWARIARFYEFDFEPAPLTLYDHAGSTPGAEARRSVQFARNMRARDLFVELHGFEAGRVGATFAYQMDSARRHLEWDEGNVRAGRRLLLKAARAAPAKPLPYVWLALSLLPSGPRGSLAGFLRRQRTPPAAAEAEGGSTVSPP